MPYSHAMNFAKKYLDCYHVPFNSYSLDSSDAFVPDMGLRHSLYMDYDYKTFFSSVSNKIEENIIYRVKDTFYCSYFIFKIPYLNNSFAFAGPYHLGGINSSVLSEIISNNNLPPSRLPILERFYNNMSHFEDDRHIQNAIITLGSIIWDDIDGFEMREINDFIDDEDSLYGLKPKHNEPEDTLLSMRLLEERYDTERLIMDAVSHGQSHKAEMYLSNLSGLQMERRSADPLRNMKNYSIIMNTLFRKAAEQGGVHPLHIDNMSSDFAKKIEAAHSISAITRLQKEMIHKYCGLVKNKSLKGYSQLVRKVIIKVDSDLSADLSLKRHAELLNVNHSYLSTLFKKETGETLTEFVNRKRVEHAQYLLTSTNLQVQVIAQQCGIPDVNYFSKTFKKITGKSPRQVRESSA